MDSDNGIAGIVLAAEQSLRLELLDHLTQAVDLAPQVLFDTFTFTSELEVSIDVLRAASKLALVRKRGFDALAFAHDLLRLFGIRPEIWVGSFLFYFGKLLAQTWRVKDTPADRALSRESLRIRVPDLQA